MKYLIAAAVLSLPVFSAVEGLLSCPGYLQFQAKYVFSIHDFRGLRGKRKIVALYPVTHTELEALFRTGTLPQRGEGYSPLFKFGLNQKVLLEFGGFTRKDSVHGLARQKDRDSDLKSGNAALSRAIALNTSSVSTDTNRSGFWYGERPCAILGLTAKAFSEPNSSLNSLDKWWKDDSLVGKELALTLPREIHFEDIGAVFSTNATLKELGIPEKTLEDLKKQNGP